MRFSNLYIKKKIKNNLVIWLKLKKNFLNSLFLNYFLKYSLIFNFNSFNSFNINFFKNSLNFTDLSLFKLNNFSKFFLMKILKNCNYFNSFGNFFFINFLSLYSKFDFCTVLLNNKNVSNFTLRFNILCLIINKNFLKYNFFFNKNFNYIRKTTDRFYKNLFLAIFKFIIKYYLNFNFLLLFNYCIFFFNSIFIIIKKFMFLNLFFNVNNKAIGEK